MKYIPEATYLGSLEAVIDYLYRELYKISQTFEIPEVTQLNYGKEVANATSATSVARDWRAGQKQKITLSNATSCAISFVAPEGVCNLMLRVIQDGTGGRAFTLPSTVKWAGGTVPTWSTTANAVDVIAMYFDGTNYHASASIDSK